MTKEIQITQIDRWEVREVRNTSQPLTGDDYAIAFSHMPMICNGYLARTDKGKWSYMHYPADVPLDKWHESWEIILYIIYRGAKRLSMVEVDS